MDSVGEGEGGKIWENGIETCKISCMKRVASPGSMHEKSILISLLHHIFSLKKKNFLFTIVRRNKLCEMKYLDAISKMTE